MTLGRYGDAWERYPVQHGDVFRAGPHTLACLDVLGDQAAIRSLVGEVDLVYSDPPWTQGILNQFYRYADEEAPHLSDVLVAYAQLCQAVCPDGLVATEMGKNGMPVLSAAFESAGAQVLATGIVTYGAQRIDAYLCVATFNPGRHDGQVIPEGLHAKQVVEWATKLPGMTMLDPFCGAGTFPLAAASKGKRVTGTELIPRKLAQALAAFDVTWTVSKERGAYL